MSSENRTIQNWCIQSAAGVLVIMGQGALNQGVSKTEIPGKSQMSGTKPQMGLTTGKWLWMLIFAPYRRFNVSLVESHQQPLCPYMGGWEPHKTLSTFQMKKVGYIATVGYVLQGSILNATCFFDFKSGNCCTMTI